MKTGRIMRKIISLAAAVVMALSVFEGTGAGLVRTYAANLTIEVKTAEFLEAGKQYIFLEETREYAMGVQNGYTSAYREAVEIEFDADANEIIYSGSSVNDIIWECMEGTDGLLKLYSQQILNEGSAYAYLHYSGCDYVQLTSTVGEQHAYNSSDHTLSSWYGSYIYYLYFAGAGYGFRKEAGNDYSHKIYAYEVISCEHSDCEHIAAVSATCLTSGNIEYWKCNTCGRLFSDLALSTEVTTVTVPAPGHDWDEGVVIQEATATTDGRIMYTCSRDPSHVKYETIPKTGEITSNVVNIKGTKATAFENGKQYIIMSYPNGGQAMLAVVRALYESSGSYNYLKEGAVSIDEDAGTATFQSTDEAEEAIFTAVENASAKGQFHLVNDGSYVYKYYSMIEMKDDEDYGSWFTYVSNSLQHVNSTLVSSYPYVAVQNNVYKGVTSTGGNSPVYIYEVVADSGSYTVNFETNGGTSIDSVTVENGGTVDKPDDPVRDDYIFDGWYVDSNKTIAYDFSTPVTESFTLYAKWVAASGESETVYVKRAYSFRDGEEYIILDSSKKLAMNTGRGNTYYDNSRAGSAITLNSDDGKTTITFKSLDDKHISVWTAEQRPAAYDSDGESIDVSGQAALMVNGKYLGTYYYTSHFPAEQNDDGTYKDNIYYYIDGDSLKSADLGNYFYYDTISSIGFRLSGTSKNIYVYEIVDEDYSHTDHTLILTPEVPATCLKTGAEAYYTCSECGEMFSDKGASMPIAKPVTIPATGHDWGEWTSLNAQQHQRICKNDSSHTETALHAWDDGRVTQEATADTEGTMTYTCTVCTAERTEAIGLTTGECPASGSSGYIIETVIATSLESGERYIILSTDNKKAMSSLNISTDYGGFRLRGKDVSYQKDDGRIVFETSSDAQMSMWTCESGTALKQDIGMLYSYMAYLWCGTSDMYAYGGDSIFVYEYDTGTGTGKLKIDDSGNYTVGYDTDYQAFCTVPGNKCILYKVTDIIGLMADNSHNLVKTARKEPGCTTDGNIEYYRCSKCGQYYSDAEGKNKLSSLSDTVIPALGHDLKLHGETTAACEEEGNTAYYECDRCGLFFSDSEGAHEIAEASWITEPLGHDWDEGEITVQPGCLSEGTRTYTCSRDSSHTKTESISSLGGHSFRKIISYETTCTEDGYDLYECSLCHEQEKRNITKAKGHTEGNPVISNRIDPEIDKNGSYDKAVYCTVCGELVSFEHVIIPALSGHHIFVTDLHQGESGSDTATSIDPDELYSGDTAFTVTSDKACVVLKENSDSSYTRLYGADTDNGYEFSVNVGNEDVNLVIILKGDTDLDGRVTSKDATLLTRYITKAGSLSDLQLMAADTDADGNINSKDATLIARNINGSRLFGWDIR